MVLTASLTEGYTPSMFSRVVPPFNLVDEITKYVTLPCTMILAFHSLFRYKEKANEVAPIKGKLNGVRKIAFSKPLCIAEAFEKAKRNRASLTDLILTAITLTFGEMIRSKNSIQVSVPFTLRDFPKDLKSLKVNNDFACLPKLLRFPTKDGKRVEIFESDQVFKETFLAKLREVN